MCSSLDCSSAEGLNYGSSCRNALELIKSLTMCTKRPNNIQLHTEIVWFRTFVLWAYDLFMPSGHTLYCVLVRGPQMEE